jgi:DNA topoisomerase-1
VKETCPDCGYEGAEAKANKTRGAYRKCLKCGNEWEAPEQVPAEETLATA